MSTFFELSGGLDHACGKEKAARENTSEEVKVSPTLGNVSENVSVSVVDAEVLNYENFKTFDTFPLRYRNLNFTASTSTCANLTLSGFGTGSFVSGDYCEWNVSYTSGVNELVNITSTGFVANYSTVINVTSGRVYFDVADVLGVFYQPNLVSHFKIISNNSFITDYQLNLTINYISDTLNSNLEKSGTAEIHLYSGNIFSNKETTEFVN